MEPEVWNPPNVERALFRWAKWRESLIAEWADPGESELTQEHLTRRAESVLRGLDLRPSAILLLYRICCVASDVNLDYEASFKKIVIPRGVQLPFDPLLTCFALEVGSRVHPPSIVAGQDLAFFSRQYGAATSVIGRDGITRMTATDNYEPNFRRGEWLLLPPGHELAAVLAERKGRPPRMKPRYLKYGDRLAVKCAASKDLGKTYLEVARQFGLPIQEKHHYWESAQSDLAMYLVRRGRKLLVEIRGEAGDNKLVEEVK
jgi:hypothetical protein